MLEDIPSPEPFAMSYWEGFVFLLQYRTADFGGGVGRIPLGEIREYLDFLFVLDYDSRLTFMEVIASLDAYLNELNREDESPAKKKAQAPPPPPPRR